MSIDFPLILVILVFGSGLVWALDAIFLARSRYFSLGKRGLLGSAVIFYTGRRRGYGLPDCENS